MAGTFSERMKHLIDTIPHVSITAKVESSQVYALYQHERADLRHPRGGGPFFLREALFAKAGDLQTLPLVSEDPGVLVRAMADFADGVADDSVFRTPVEFGDLRGSPHPSVIKDGETVHDRPPHVPRLSESELRAKHRHGPSPFPPGGSLS